MLYINTQKIFFFETDKSPIFFFYVLELTLFNLVFSCFSFTFLTFSFISSYLSFSLKITINSSWLIYVSISAWEIKVSLLLSLLLANTRILSCFFFLFLVMLNNFLTIPVVKEKIKVKLALAIWTGPPTMLILNDRYSTTCCA